MNREGEWERLKSARKDEGKIASRSQEANTLCEPPRCTRRKKSRKMPHRRPPLERRPAIKSKGCSARVAEKRETKEEQEQTEEEERKARLESMACNTRRQRSKSGYLPQRVT